MTQDGEQGGPAQEVARRVKEVRTKRGLTAAALAARLTELGVPWDRSIVANLESGRRRTVTVDELLALALALNAPPLYLLVPPDNPDEPYPVTATVTESRASVRKWITGEGPMLPRFPLVGDIREFYTEVPEEKFGAMQQGRCPCCGENLSRGAR